MIKVVVALPPVGPVAVKESWPVEEVYLTLEIWAALYIWMLQPDPQEVQITKLAIRLPEEDTVPVVGLADTEFSVTPPPTFELHPLNT